MRGAGEDAGCAELNSRLCFQNIFSEFPGSYRTCIVFVFRQEKAFVETKYFWEPNSNKKGFSCLCRISAVLESRRPRRMDAQLRGCCRK